MKAAGIRVLKANCSNCRSWQLSMFLESSLRAEGDLPAHGGQAASPGCGLCKSRDGAGQGQELSACGDQKGDKEMWQQLRLTLVQGRGHAALHPRRVVIHNVDGDVGVPVGDHFHRPIVLSPLQGDRNGQRSGTAEEASGHLPLGATPEGSQHTSHRGHCTLLTSAHLARLKAACRLPSLWIPNPGTEERG